MKRLGVLLILLATVLLSPARAQDEGATRIERFLQDSLSGEGRTVTIRGFRGALTGRAELASLTVSDSDGDWLTLADAVLDWDRAALLQGRLEVREISAARIDLQRLPGTSSNQLPSPEASGTVLSLPDLPVSIEIGRLLAETVNIGPAVFGQPIVVTSEGRLSLANGEGSAEFGLSRTDGQRGTIEIDAAFSNTTGVLDLRALFDEAPGGISATALGLPGAPAVRLSINGSGEIDNFATDVTLATDGATRLDAEFVTSIEDGTRIFDVAAQGDLRPLFIEEYQGFFGETSELSAKASRSDLGTAIEDLELSTAALDLGGKAFFAADGMPQRFDLNGSIANPGGGPLTLPVSGSPTTISAAKLDLSFDASQNDQWQGLIEISELKRAGLAADVLTLDGSGLIKTGPNRATLGADFKAITLDFGAEAAQAAFGESVEGRIDLKWETGRPLELSTLRLEGESYRADLSGTVSNPTSSLDLSGRGAIRIEKLEAFAGLIDRPLSGSLSVSVNGSAGVFTGLVDLRGAALGNDLVVGEARLDPYLVGTSAIEVALRRTVSGSFLDTLRITGRDSTLEADGELQSASGRLDARAQLQDIAPLYAGLSGAGSVQLASRMEDAVWTYDSTATAMQAELTANGTASGLPLNTIVDAAGTLSAASFEPFSELVGRPLAGAGDVTFALRFDPSIRTISLDTEGAFFDASLGIPQVNAILAGETKLYASAEIDSGGIALSRLQISSDAADIDAKGVVDDGIPREAEIDARFSDVSDLLPGLNGQGELSLSLGAPGADGAHDFIVSAASPDLMVSSQGTVLNLNNVPIGSGMLSAEVDDLSVFSPFFDQPIGGQLSLSASGSLTGNLSTFDLEAEASTLNLAAGIRDLDQLLAGQGRFSVGATKDQGTIVISRAEMETPLASASGVGTIGPQTSFDFDARLANIAPFVPGLSGIMTATGQAQTLGNGRASVTAKIEAPAGTNASISGDVSEDGSDANLRVSGRAALALLNRVLAPRAMSGTADFDLTLRGRPGLEAVAGQIAVDGARLIAPVAGLGLDDIAGTISIAGATGDVALTSRFESGGEVRLTGPVNLAAPQTADLDLQLSGVRLTDPSLYQTRLNGSLSINGPLQGGAQIAGQIDVGETEVRVPTGGARGRAGLPEIRHIDEPSSVRETRRRAGLLEPSNSRETAGVPFPLDVTIDAPNRIFVRGRGLDAELGGRLRLRGTTRDVEPEGRLDLIRGRLDILGRRLEMTSGGVLLSGALDPEIQLVAETEAEDVDVEIRLEGPASDPEVSFLSRPELPEDEVLALLLFGQGVDNLSPLQIARLAAAVATLGSSGGGLIGSARAGAGLADLDVTSNGDGGAAVRAGAYINENVYTDLSVDTEGNSEVQLNLDLSDSLKVRGRTSTTGNSGFGVFFERDY